MTPPTPWSDSIVIVYVFVFVLFGLKLIWLSSMDHIIILFSFSYMAKNFFLQFYECISTIVLFVCFFFPLTCLFLFWSLCDKLCTQRLTNLSISLCPMQEKIDVILTTACHSCPRWTSNELRTSTFELHTSLQHPRFTLADRQ